MTLDLLKDGQEGGNIPQNDSNLFLWSRLSMKREWRIHREYLLEWIELERDYNNMMASFDIQDADTKNTLILLCKTNLKMNQCFLQDTECRFL